MYRCIELLQPLYFFKDFHLRLGISKSLVEFCEDFYDTIKLPPRFGDSFDKLIETIADKPEISFYKIRNEIVHLRPKQTDDLIPNGIDDWNKLILALLTTVNELYSNNEDLFTGGQRLSDPYTNAGQAAQTSLENLLES